MLCFNSGTIGRLRDWIIPTTILLILLLIHFTNVLILHLNSLVNDNSSGKY